MELFAPLDGLELLERGGQSPPREFRDWSMCQWSQTSLSWRQLVAGPFWLAQNASIALPSKQLCFQIARDYDISIVRLKLE